MVEVNRKQVRQVSDNQYTAKAADLYWFPMSVPHVLTTDLGNGAALTMIGACSRFLVFNQTGTKVILRVYRN